MFLQNPGRLLQLLSDVATVLDFSLTHPFRNGLFGPVISWVTEERDLLQRLRTGGDMLDSDLESAWEILTVNFEEYRTGIRAVYLKYVRETYVKAGIPIPEG